VGRGGGRPGDGHHERWTTPGRALRRPRPVDGLAPPADYRVAARYTALRYLWWTLEAWREDRGAAGWVEHYVAMLGGGPGGPRRPPRRRSAAAIP
jgi:hypothetical protein